MSECNVDPAELRKFGALAARWWDPRGELRVLHEVNPTRAAYVAERLAAGGGRVLDVGCGGGLLCEALARAGAAVTGIDACAEAVAAARAHLAESGLTVDYACATAEDYARGQPGAFDAVTCMELLEHVPDPAALVAACAALARRGGSLFFSTLNRTPLAYALTVLGSEYLLRLLPKGTHDYRRFVRPAELARWGRAAGLELLELRGLHYNPLTHRSRLSAAVRVDYLAWFRRR